MVQETQSWKKPSHEKGGPVAPCIGPEFKCQYLKKKKKILGR
jgi:hypothetical protein